MGHCQVRASPNSNPEINTGLTYSISQEKIMEVQCELFISSFKDPKTSARVREIVGDISDGSSPHCAGALKLGLKKAFELKKKNRPPPGVLLRCPYASCLWYEDPPTYASVGSNIYCPNCRYSGNRYLQCSGCGYNRTARYPSCQSCLKRFL